MNQRATWESLEQSRLARCVVTLSSDRRQSLSSLGRLQRLGGGGEEVPAARESLVPDQSQARFVDEGGWLERLTGPLPGQPCGGEFAEFGVDQREQVRGGLAVSGRGR